MIWTYTEVNTINDILSNFLTNRNGEVLFLPNQDVAHISNIEDCNIEYCNNNNIFIMNISNRKGGTIITSHNDFNYFIAGQSFDVIIKGKFIMQNILGYLQMKLQQDHNIILDRNDILIDGYKVASYSDAIDEEHSRYVFAAQFSINTDIELINNICQKLRSKEPNSLCNFGITRDELIQIIQEKSNEYGWSPEE